MSSYTISSDTYLDQITSPALTGGDNFTVNAGINLTIRTDTRFHENSPASMVGTLGYINNYGKVTIDATQVRWIRIGSSSVANVPAPGTHVYGTLGGSGIILGIWSYLYSAPVTVGTVIPKNSFIKFLSVSVPFQDGETLYYTGDYEIGEAMGPDRAGWIEVVGDSHQNAYLYYSTTKEFELIGDWFYLDDTNGSLEQEIYFPTNGSSTSGSYGSNLPGLWIETSPGTDEYEFWPALTSTYYFDAASLGMPIGGTDERQKFVLSGPECFSLAYYNYKSMTYSHTKLTGKTYTESGGYLTISSSGHHFVPGDLVYLDFDAGGPGAAFDGQYTVTSISGTSTFTVYIAGMSGTGSGSNLGHSSYCVITASSHGLPYTKQLSLIFASHGSMDGDYLIYYKDTNTFRVNFPYDGNASGSGQYGIQIGHLPKPGCKTRIPNIILRTADPAARANNYANGGSTPYTWSTASSGFPGGKLTMDKVTGDNYFYFRYGTNTILKNSSFLQYVYMDYGSFLEDVDNCGFSRGSFSTVSFSYCDYVRFTNCVFANTTSLSSTNSADFYNCLFLSPRPTYLALPHRKAYFENCEFVNFQVNPATDEVYFESCDFCCSASLSLYTGEYTYLTTYLWSNSTSYTGKFISMNNITFGKNNTIDDQCFTHLCSSSYHREIILTNFGTPDNFIKVSGNVYRSSSFAPQLLTAPAGFGNNWRIQKIYMEYLYYGVIGTTTAVQSGIITDVHVLDQYYKYAYILARGNKYANICTGGLSSLATSPSTNFDYTTFGTNYFTIMDTTDDTKGDLYLIFPNPGKGMEDHVEYGANTVHYLSQYGGIMLTQVGQSITLETPFPILSFSAFENTAPTLTGASTGNFTITYALKSGGSYGTFKTLSAANLSAEVINPYTGFEMKIKVECTTAGTSNELRNIKIPMTTTSTYKYISYPITDDVCEESTATGECPTAEDIADAVRTNLATELGLISSYIDAAISSRLASDSYTAPPTAAENADAVWDEILSAEEHNIATSAGRRLRQLASDVIIDGTAASATSNTIVLDGDASAVDGSYDPGYIVICEGTGSGQTRIITEYIGATKTAVVNRSWKTIPDATSKYVIMGYADIQSVNEGRATGSGVNTLTLNALASDVDDTYKGQLLFITSGTGEDQTGIIVSYDGATRTATIDRDWVTLPDTTSNYVMLPASPVLIAAIEHVGAIIPKVKTVDVSLVNL